MSIPSVETIQSVDESVGSATLMALDGHDDDLADRNNAPLPLALSTPPTKPRWKLV